MRWLARAALLSIAVVLLSSSVAQAEEKMLGTVMKIDVAKDRKSAVVVLKDSSTAADVTITITDDGTLQKFERNVIGVGDEIRCKYEKKGAKNLSTSFKKAAGCS